MTLLKMLKKVDAYPRTLENISIKTLSGAGITIISSIVIIILMYCEFCNYIVPGITEELFVDTTRRDKLRINVDLKIHSIGCNFLSLDAMDSSGNQHLRIEHNIFKIRLDLHGNPILKEKPIREIVETLLINKANQTCGSCYGAEYNKTHCCNSCEAVMDAYMGRKWSVQVDKIKQCKGAETYPGKASPTKEGCQVKGFIEVNRMSGSFHIAPGASFSISQFHVHDFRYTDVNIDHTITHLSFGEKLGEFANTHPLDGLIVESKLNDVNRQMFNYYIKIVPTIYVKNSTHIVNTNQFSVTRHKKILNDNAKGMPGLFFSYELSPLMVKYSNKQRSVGHLITSCCSIFGGMFTVAGIIANILQNFCETMKNRVLHGKLN